MSGSAAVGCPMVRTEKLLSSSRGDPEDMIEQDSLSWKLLLSNRSVSEDMTEQDSPSG